MPARRFLPLSALLLMASCAAGPPGADPWARTRAGTWGLGVRPALFTLYEIDGTFVSKNFDPPPDEIVSHDAGDIEGRLGVAVEGQYYLSDCAVLSLGVDYRVYDIKGLTPTPDLDTAVDRIESRQYFASLRYLGQPASPRSRIRPYGQASIAWLPRVDVGFDVDLSEFGSSNLSIDARGEGFWVGGLGAGLLYSWRDRWVVECGLLYEFPITPLEVDLSFDVGPAHFPLAAEFAPAGLVGGCGLSYQF